MVPPASHRISRVPWYSGTCLIRTWFSNTRLSLAMVGLSRTILLTFPASRWQSYNPGEYTRRFGLFPVRSPLLGESRLISFPQGTEMFHFPWYGSILVIEVRSIGFPHSDIHGSSLIRQLPEAFRSPSRPSSPSSA